MVHPEIRRNTILLFIAQVLLSASTVTQSQTGGPIVYQLTKTATLAGLPTAIFYLAVASVAYPAGRFMDRRGRRPGLVLGFLLAGLGAVLTAAGVTAGALAGYLLGAVIFSIGVAFGVFTRASVSDMYPPQRRGTAVGVVATGGLVGAVTGPMLVALGDGIGRATGRDPLAVPWALTLVTFGIGALAVWRLRPDPREIGLRLRAYFPDAPEMRPVAGVDPDRVRAILSLPSIQAAIVSVACAQGSMATLMATAALMLHLHGHETGTISLVMMAHFLGMYGLSIPIGRLADRVGRRPLLIGGALLSASSGLLFTLGVQSAAMSAVTFYLVGLGWSLASVAGTTLIADLSATTVRARVFGVNDLATSLTAMAAALAGGVLLARGGPVLVGSVAAVVGSFPLLTIVRAGDTIRRTPSAVPAGGGS